MIIPEQLVANCCKIPEREKWLDSLPGMIAQYESKL